MPRLDDEVAFGVGALLTTRPQQMSPSQLDGSSCPSGPGSAPSNRSLTNRLPVPARAAVHAGFVHPRAGSAPRSRQRTANGWSRRPDRLLAIRPL